MPDMKKSPHYIEDFRAVFALVFANKKIKNYRTFVSSHIKWAGDYSFCLQAVESYQVFLLLIIYLISCPISMTKNLLFLYQKGVQKYTIMNIV